MALNIESEFKRLAGKKGFIGSDDKRAKLSAAYCRVSTDKQSEEGKTGLPRQIQHIHEIAEKENLRIPWELVFYDDYTGFKASRPIFDDLISELESLDRRFDHVVIEHLDRLSRDMDHQNRILAGFQGVDATLVSWTPIPDRITRIIQGLASDELRRRTQQQLKDAYLAKVENGEILVSHAAVGYQVERNEKKELKYVIDQERYVLPLFIYESMASGNYTVRKVVDELNEKMLVDSRFRPIRKTTKIWGESSVVKILHNTAYKGEVISNRFYEEEVSKNPRRSFWGRDSWKDVKKVRRERPESEWKYAECPPIVTSAVWERANRNLWNNKAHAVKNKRREYVLASRLRCAECNLVWCGHFDTDRGGVKRYICTSAQKSKAYRELHPCSQGSIHCDVLDKAVFELVCDLLRQPERIIEAIEKRYTINRAGEYEREIETLHKLLTENDVKQTKDYDLYYAGIDSLEEYGQHKRDNQKQRAYLLDQLKKVETESRSLQELEEQKQTLIRMVQNGPIILAIPKGIRENEEEWIRFQKETISQWVDMVYINNNEGWFEVVGPLGRRKENLPAPSENKRQYSFAIWGKYTIRYSLTQKRILELKVA